MVACEPGFDKQPAVINGFSDLILEVFGPDIGAHSRSAVGMSTTLRFDGWAIPRTQFLLPLAFYTPLGRLWQYRERPPYGVKNERVRAWIERELRHRKVSRAGSSVIGVGHLREHDRLIRHVRRNLGNVQCDNVLALHGDRSHRRTEGGRREAHRTLRRKRQRARAALL